MHIRDRFMRVLVFFDLPMVLDKDLKIYRQFRKEIMHKGYIMNQFSIYVKLCINSQTARRELNYLESVCPVKGNIQVLIITEKQYGSIVYIAGEARNKIINSTDRIITI
jgi:CRISPR-associated protein Cas2